MSSRIAAWPPVRSIATATGVTKKSSPFVVAFASSCLAGIESSRLVPEGEVGSARIRIALASARARRTLGRASEEDVISTNAE